MTALTKRLTPTDLALIAGTFGILAYLFYPTLREIALICWNDDDYSHGLLLPFIAGYMIWDKREQIFTRIRKADEDAIALPRVRRRENAWVGAELVLLVGLVLFFLGEASGIIFTSWVAFFPTVLAAIHLLFGRTTALALAAPVLLLFMAKPLPDSFVVRLFWPLQVLAAKVSAETLELFRVPVYLSGNIIEIPAMKLMVEEACSGMRSVMALVTLALIVIYFVELRAVAKLALVAIAISVAVILNVVRVAMTGLLAHFYDPSTATGFFHTFSGLIVFVVGLPLLYYAGVLLMRLDQKLAARSAGEGTTPKEEG